MSIELCILASGSSGNCALIRTPAGAMLIDCGIGPRMTAARLNGTGVRIADLSAICLTHLDRDHFNPTWVSTLARFGMRVYCHASRVDDLKRVADCEAFAKLICPFNVALFSPLDDLSAQPISLAHDAAGSHGFLLDGFGSRAGYATDLGRVPDRLIESFVDLDFLAMESNYDRQMQLNSGRPWFLQQRIMGGKGHLSNEQAFDAVRKILDRCQRKCARLPSHVVLLHRSRQCNCPDRVRDVFSRDIRITPRLTLAEQHERTDWLRSRPYQPVIGEQLVLNWG